MISLSSPQLPSVERLAPYISQIDSARFYTNGGAMSELLRHRLALHYELEEQQIALAGSGTAAITSLLFANAGRARAEKPFCLCPSFTFAATATAAQSCGYVPWFVDIDPEAFSLNPTRIATSLDLSRVGAVLVVAPFGRMVDLLEWQAFYERTKIHVVVDAAACFDTIELNVLRQVQIPVAISLHATKTLSTAEGGMMICSDSEVVKRAAAAVNFGFLDKRISEVPGFNGKLSEYHAVIGLADLDNWVQKRAGFVQTAKNYADAAHTQNLQGCIVNEERATPYAHYLAPDVVSAVKVTAALDAADIQWRRWYGPGLAEQPAFAECPSEPLPVTAEISKRLIGLPFSGDLGRLAVETIVNVIAVAKAAP